MTFSHRRRALVGVLAVLVLTTAACSDDRSGGALGGITVVSGTSSAPTATASGTASAGTTSAVATTTTTTATTPRPVPAPPSRDDANVDARDFGDAGSYYFRSPTSNVFCGIFPDGSAAGRVGCQAADSVNPTSGPTCTDAGNDKFAVTIGNDGTPQHLCTTQGVYVGSNDKPLEYGQVLFVQNISCSSDESTGITCWDGATRGFTLSREINRTY